MFKLVKLDLEATLFDWEGAPASSGHFENVDPLFKSDILFPIDKVISANHRSQGNKGRKCTSPPLPRGDGNIH